MAAYVDDLKSTAPYVNNGKGFANRFSQYCHLIADTEEELHEFAKKIGMRREWAQHHGRMVHYDLTASRRVRAVKEGAVRITTRELVMKRFRKKK